MGPRVRSELNEMWDFKRYDGATKVSKKQNCWEIYPKVKYFILV